MKYKELYKSNREMIIDRIEDRGVNVRLVMLHLLEKNGEKDIEYMLNIYKEDGEGEKELIQESVDFSIHEVIMKVGTAAQHHLEEIEIKRSAALMGCR